MNLTSAQKGHIYWPLFHRMKAFDWFLPGFFIAGFLTFLSRFSFSPAVQQWVFIGSLFAMVVVINRAGFLLAGRVSVSSNRLKRVIAMLLKEEGRLNLREFAVLAGVPLQDIQKAVDIVMVENIYMGYIDAAHMDLVVEDEPLAGKKCPVCGGVLNEQVVLNKVCTMCDAVFYV